MTLHALRFASAVVAMVGIWFSAGTWAEQASGPAAGQVSGPVTGPVTGPGTQPAAVNAGRPVPGPPQIFAQNYLLIDADTGFVIVEHEADARINPASLTKILTDYVVAAELAAARITVEDQVPISVNAWKMGGSQMFIREGTQVKLQDLLHGLVIQSGNDAAVALAEYVAGSEDAFAHEMNVVAQRIGMTGSHFSNSSGLPAPDHYSTARDLARLSVHLIKDFPEQYKLYAEKSFTFNGIVQRNRNDLLFRDRTVDGIKTGYTEDAGYCLIASAVREDMRLIAVVLNTASEKVRAQEADKLLSYGFRYFQTHALYQTGQELQTVPVWSGAVDELKLIVPHALSLTVPRGRYGDLVAEAEIDHIIRAPIEANDVLGRIKVTLDGKVVAEAPLVAQNEVQPGNIFKRIWHGIYLFFSELFS